MATVLAVLFAAILGAMFLLWGYRVFLVMLPVWGFFAGFWLGAAGISLFLGQGFLVTITGWVVGFILGVIGALASYMFYGLAVGLIGALVGAAISSVIMGALGLDSGWIVGIISLIVAGIAAVLTLKFNLQKYVVILFASLTGADLIMVAGLLLFGVVSLSDLQGAGNLLAPVFEVSWLAVIAWLALTVAGIVYQLRSNREFTFEKDAYVEAWG